MTDRLVLRDLTQDDTEDPRAFSCTAAGGAAGVATIERQITNLKVIRAAEHVPGGRCLGALLDGRVVGVAFTEPLPDNAPLPEDMTGGRFVRLFAVHDDVQGVLVDGVGKVSDRLLRFVHEEMVDDVGTPCAVALKVERRNERARAFYLRNHYSEAATRSGIPVLIRRVERTD